MLKKYQQDKDNKIQAHATDGLTKCLSSQQDKGTRIQSNGKESLTGCLCCLKKIKTKTDSPMV